MTRLIALANQKGGVGKTTTTLNLGAALRERGRRVLLVDLDPQASLTLAMGVPPEDLTRTVYDALMSAARAQDDGGDGFARPTALDIDLIPASIELSQAEFDLTREPLGIYALRDFVEGVRDDYDYILLDCPPSLGILTANALAAAQEVIIPLQTDYLALKGVDLLLNTIAKMQKRANSALSVRGILLTMADLRTLHAQEVIDAVRATYEPTLHVFESIVQLSVRLKEAPLVAQSVLAYAGSSQAAQAYRAVAEEIDK